MSIKAIADVLDNCPVANATQRLMAVSIADNANDEGIAFPGVDRLAHKVRITRRHAPRVLAALEDAGELLIDYQCGVETGSGKTNKYYLLRYRKEVLGIDDTQLRKRILRDRLMEHWKKQGMTLESSLKKTQQKTRDDTAMSGVGMTQESCLEPQGMTQLCHTNRQLFKPSVKPSVIAPNGAARWIAQVSLLKFIQALMPALKAAHEELEAKRERPSLIAAIIKAKVDSDIDRKIPHNKQANPWMNKTERGWCEAILDAGFMPEDVVAYIADLVQESFWHGRSISLKYIAQNIRAWAEKPIEPERESFQEFTGEIHKPIVNPELWRQHQENMTRILNWRPDNNVTAANP